MSSLISHRPRRPASKFGQALKSAKYRQHAYSVDCGQVKHTDLGSMSCVELGQEEVGQEVGQEEVAEVRAIL